MPSLGWEKVVGVSWVLLLKHSQQQLMCPVQPQFPHRRMLLLPLQNLQQVRSRTHRAHAVGTQPAEVLGSDAAPSGACGIARLRGLVVLLPVLVVENNCTQNPAQTLGLESRGEMPKRSNGRSASPQFRSMLRSESRLRRVITRHPKRVGS